MTSNCEISLEKRSALPSLRIEKLTIFKVGIEVNALVRVVCTMLRRYAETDSVIECPCKCRPQKMSGREDRLIGVISKRYQFKIACEVGTGINENLKG